MYTGIFYILISEEVTKHNFYILCFNFFTSSFPPHSHLHSPLRKSNNSFKYSIYFTALLSLLPFEILNSKKREAFHCVKVPRLIFDLRFPICNYKLYFTSYTVFFRHTVKLFGSNLYALCLPLSARLVPIKVGAFLL